MTDLLRILRDTIRDVAAADEADAAALLGALEDHPERDGTHLAAAMRFRALMLGVRAAVLRGMVGAETR